MNRFFTVVLTLLLGACANVGSVNGFDGPERPDSEVAILVTEQRTQPQVNNPLVYLRAVDGVSVGKVSKLRLLPGAHAVETECRVAGYSGTLQLKNNFEAGHTYEVYCVDEGKNAMVTSRDLGTAYTLPSVFEKPEKAP